MNGLTILLLYLIGITLLAYFKSGLVATAVATGVLLIVYLVTGVTSWLVFLILLATLIGTILLSQTELRRDFVSEPLFRWYRNVLPKLSETEQEAINAGSVWWEGQLFSGKPEWEKLLSAGKPQISETEQAFIDGPVEELCRMVDSWHVNFELVGIPDEVMDYVKQERFLGLIIPEEYGGRGLSTVAQIKTYTKLFGVSSVIANFISVPNSLGPGELLHKYGTEEQKKLYLPRLASGDEIPCFALTGPLAGSDATSIPDTGVVCKGNWEGNEIIGMRLTFNKRYITLAPIATLVGLAFKLQDPDHLIGDIDEYGITCALIPRNTPGLDIGKRHFPMGDPFLNGPIRGKDIFVPLDYIIGGRDMAGKGWRMLVECLSVGRSISLPSTANCLAKRGLAGASAYANIRRQFNLPIARFEGVQKPLARIAGLAYITNACCTHTAQAIDMGAKPAVAGSILKYHCTEMARQVALDAADIHAGKCVMKGPNNYLSYGYEAVPVAITVEGANIMTRSLMIFGQGATRCHPFVLKEIEIAGKETSAGTVAEFDKVLFGHVAYTLQNAARAMVHALTGSIFTGVLIDSPVKRYYQHIERLSAAFTLVTDASMLTLQGSLKRREMLSARLGDLLSMLYLASMVLKHYENEGCPEEDLPVVEWSCQYLLHGYQVAMDELLNNFPNRPLAWMLRLVIFPLGKWFDMPADILEARIATLVSRDTGTRSRLLDGIYATPGPTNPLGLVNEVFMQSLDVDHLQHKLRQAVKAGEVKPLAGLELINAAEQAGVLDNKEAQQLREYDTAMMSVINVDEFEPEDLTRMQSATPAVKKKATKERKASKKSAPAADDTNE